MPLVRSVLTLGLAVMTSPVLAQMDTATAGSSSKVTVFKPKRLSPAQVTLYAALIPTFGQFYNRSYWKVPVFLGLGGWCVYNYVRQNDLYALYRERYRDDLRRNPVPPNAEFNRRLRDFYRGQRDEFAVYVALVYALSIIDAYIDAHLFDFDTSDSLAIASPEPSGATVSLFKLRVSF
ncbi:MAG: DUF5683 domain-containing protein [Chloroherpetonaceae bacterium]|nr:DUF5683 domain-containing protein [Chloroherpetonaceae bacterium]MDW8436966.1 DUF5683 domain-containing protein [Chloroherpetonaceae bacterium]